MSNIVEAIFVQLGLDTKGYAQDAEKAVRQNENLEKSLSNTEKSAQKTDKAMSGMGKSAEKTASQIGGLKTLLKGLGLNDIVKELEKAENAANKSAEALVKKAEKEAEDAAKLRGKFAEAAKVQLKKERDDAIQGISDDAQRKHDIEKAQLEADLNLGKISKGKKVKAEQELEDNLYNVKRQGLIQRLELLEQDSNKAQTQEEFYRIKNEKHSTLGELAELDKKQAITKIERSGNKANLSIQGLKKGLSGLKVALASVFAVIAAGMGFARLANDAAKVNDELYFLEKNLGMSSKQIQAWRGVAEASGGSAEGMTSTIKNLTQAVSNFIVMGDTSMLPYFNALGVSMVDANGKARDMSDLLLDMSDSLSGMNRQQAYSIASQMGLDEGTINTLLQGRDAMQNMIDLQKQMYQSSQEDLENSRELNKQQALMRSQWNSIKLMIGNALVPVLTKVAEVVNRIFMFMQKHQKTVKNVFEGAAIVLGVLLIPMLLKALAVFGLFIAPFAPFIILVTALGAAFIALYDDYKVWSEGGQSLFDWGKFSDFIEGALGSVDKLKAGFRSLISTYKEWSRTMNDKIAETETGRDVLDIIGEGTARVLAFFGNKEAQEAVATNEKNGTTSKAWEGVEHVTGNAAARVMALFGNKDAQIAVAANDKADDMERYKDRVENPSWYSNDGVYRFMRKIGFEKLMTEESALDKATREYNQKKKDLEVKIKNHASPEEKVKLEKELEAARTEFVKISNVYKAKEEIRQARGDRLPTAPLKDGATGAKAEFIKEYWGVASIISKKLNVPVDAVLAQFAQETGWGKSVIKGTNNLGNIKAGSSWGGKTVKAYDKVEKSNDAYRVYDTPEEFAEDYIKLIGGSNRYKNVIGSKTPEEFFTNLKNAGYATDVNYVKTGMSVTQSVNSELKSGRPAAIAAGARRAQEVIDEGKTSNSSASHIVNNHNNQKTVDVKVGDIKVQTTANTISGVTNDAMAALNSNVQLMTGYN